MNKYLTLFLFAISSAAGAQLTPGLAPTPLSQTPVFQALQGRVSAIEARDVWLNVASGTDITSALQSAVSAGKYVHLPKGTFVLSSPINATSGASAIVGVSRSTTLLVCAMPDTPGNYCIRFGPTTTNTGAQLTEFTLGNLTLAASSQRTYLTGFVADQAVDVLINDTKFVDLAGGIDIAGGSNIYVRGVTDYYGDQGTSSTVAGTYSLRARAGYLGTTPNAQVTFGLFVSDFDVIGPGSGTPRRETCLILQAIDGGYFNGNNYFGQCVTLADLQPQNATTYLANIQFNGGMFDGAGGLSTTGIKLRENASATSAAINKITFHGTNVSGLNGTGILIDAPLAANTVLSGITSESNAGICIDIERAGSVVLSGSAIGYCGTTSNAATGALKVTSGTNTASITGNTIYGTKSGASNYIHPSDPANLKLGYNATSGGAALPTVGP